MNKKFIIVSRIVLFFIASFSLFLFLDKFFNIFINANSKNGDSSYVDSLIFASVWSLIVGYVEIKKYMRNNSK